MTLRVTRASVLGIRIGSIISCKWTQDARDFIMKVDEIKDDGVIGHDAYTSNWKAYYHDIVEVLT